MKILVNSSAIIAWKDEDLSNESLNLVPHQIIVLIQSYVIMVVLIYEILIQNFYIVYDIDHDDCKDFALGNSLFGAVKMNKKSSS